MKDTYEGRGQKACREVFGENRKEREQEEYQEKYQEEYREEYQKKHQEEYRGEYQERRNRRRAARAEGHRQRRNLQMLVCLGIVTLLFAGNLLFLKNGTGDETTTSLAAGSSQDAAQQEMAAAENAEASVGTVDFGESTVGLEDICQLAQITRYFTYGTNFCMDGTAQLSVSQPLQTLSVILKPQGEGEDGEAVTVYSAQFEQNGLEVSFATYSSINSGISLEEFDPGEYCMLLEAEYRDGGTEWYSLENAAGTEVPICYYTLTDEEGNNRIDIGFNTAEEMEYLSCSVCAAPLPEDVYDIVLDAGHGVTDVGAVYGSYYESEIALDYALELAAALEQEGFKVQLTRDGTEDEDIATAYTMYDVDGRVNVACASGAKYCLSLHLNSDEGYVTTGGIQVYESCRCEEQFAMTLVNNILENVGLGYSDMETYLICPGVYARAFSEEDILSGEAAALEAGYAPYALSTDTDYYYMIRELGGIATNAYADGRNTVYGTNLYYDSLQGVESYILELGFISVQEDLNAILNQKEEYIDAIVKSFEEA